MNQLSETILNTLLENNIKKEDVLETLSLIYGDLEVCLWEVVEIQQLSLYSLKDIIWYNLEHIPSGGEIKGLSNLRFLGTKYKNLIYAFNNSEILKLEDVYQLFNELENILSIWDKDWKIVSLYTKSLNGWNGGDNPSQVIIYTSNESPRKYGYDTNYSNIFGKNGEPIKKLDHETVLCEVIDGTIGEYANSQILYNLVIVLKEACRKAIKNQKDLRIKFI